MYVDYAYYTTEYGGKTSEIDFTSLELRASATVDYYTFGRIETVELPIKNAVCELIDLYAQLEKQGGKEIASESVASHSVSYVAEDNISSRKKEKQIIQRHLAHSGLLYRGVGL